MNMKTKLQRAATVVRRAFAWYQMRSIEITLADTVNALPYVADADTREAMRLSIKRMSRQLCKARAHYQSFFKPGQRHTWSFA